MTTHNRVAAARCRFGSLAVGLAGTAALALVAAPLSSAALPASHSRSAAVRASTATPQPYFAGYGNSESHGLASVSATFKIPTLNCSTGISTPEYIGAYSGPSVPPKAEAQITLACNGTTPTYTYHFSTAAGSFNEPGAAPGDTVVTSFYQTGSWTQAEIHDLTNGDNWYANTGAASTDFGYAVGVKEPNTTSPIAQFTPVTFTSVQVNGTYLGYDTPIQYNLVRGADTLATTSVVTPHGSAFNVTFRRST
jgi:hypothetical protein